MIFNRKPDLSLSRSEIPESNQEATHNDLASEILRPSTKNILSQIKAQGEFAQSQRSRDAQNFVRRNINYVTHAKLTGKNAHTMCNSFVDVDTKAQSRSDEAKATQAPNMRAPESKTSQSLISAKKYDSIQSAETSGGKACEKVLTTDDDHQTDPKLSASNGVTPKQAYHPSKLF